MSRGSGRGMAGILAGQGSRRSPFAFSAAQRGPRPSTARSLLQSSTVTPSSRRMRFRFIQTVAVLCRDGAGQDDIAGGGTAGRAVGRRGRPARGPTGRRCPRRSSKRRGRAASTVGSNGVHHLAGAGAQLFEVVGRQPLVGEAALGPLAAALFDESTARVDDEPVAAGAPLLRDLVELLEEALGQVQGRARHVQLLGLPEHTRAVRVARRVVAGWRTAPPHDHPTSVRSPITQNPLPNGSLQKAAGRGPSSRNRRSTVPRRRAPRRQIGAAPTSGG